MKLVLFFTIFFIIIGFSFTQTIPAEVGSLSFYQANLTTLDNRCEWSHWLHILPCNSYEAKVFVDNTNPSAWIKFRLQIQRPDYTVVELDADSSLNVELYWVEGDDTADNWLLESTASSYYKLVGVIADPEQAGNHWEWEWTQHCFNTEDHQNGWYHMVITSSSERKAKDMNIQLQICDEDVSIAHETDEFTRKSCEYPAYELNLGPYSIESYHDPWQYDSVEQFSAHFSFIVPDFTETFGAAYDRGASLHLRIHSLSDREGVDDYSDWFATIREGHFVTAYYDGANVIGACDYEDWITYSGKTGLTTVDHFGDVKRDDHIDIWIPRCVLQPAEYYVSVIPPHSNMCDEVINYEFSAHIEILDMEWRQIENSFDGSIVYENEILEGFALPLPTINDFTSNHKIQIGQVHPFQYNIAPQAWARDIGGPIDRYNRAANWYQLDLSSVIDVASQEFPTLQFNLHGAQWGRRTDTGMWKNIHLPQFSSDQEEREAGFGLDDQRTVTLLVSMDDLPLGSLHYKSYLRRNTEGGSEEAIRDTDPDGACSEAQWQCTAHPDRYHVAGDYSTSNCRITLHSCDYENYAPSNGIVYVGVAPIHALWGNPWYEGEEHIGLDLDTPLQAENVNNKRNINSPYSGQAKGYNGHHPSNNNVELQWTLQDMDLRYSLSIESIEVEVESLTRNEDSWYKTGKVSSKNHWEGMITIEDWEASRENGLEFEVYAPHSTQNVQVYISYGDRALPEEECGSYEWMCETSSSQSSCVWNLEGCDFMYSGDYYVSVYASDQSADKMMVENYYGDEQTKLHNNVLSHDQEVSFTLKAHITYPMEITETEVPHSQSVWPESYNHYHFYLKENNQTVALRVRIADIQNGNIIGYLQKDEVAGSCNCYTHEFSCTPEEGESHCDIYIPYCVHGYGNYYFSVYGDSNSWTSASSQEYPRNGKIGYTLTTFVHNVDWVDWLPPPFASDPETKIDIRRTIPATVDEHGIMKFVDDIKRTDVAFRFFEPVSMQIRPHAVLSLGHGAQSILGSESQYYYFQYSGEQSVLEEDGISSLVLTLKYINHEMIVPTDDTLSVFVAPYAIANDHCNCWSCTASFGDNSGYSYCKIVLEECDLLPSNGTTYSGDLETWYITVRYDQYDTHNSLPLDYNLEIELKSNNFEEISDSVDVFSSVSSGENKYYWFDPSFDSSNSGFVTFNVEFYINRESVDDVELLMWQGSSASDEIPCESMASSEIKSASCYGSDEPAEGETSNQYSLCTFTIHACDYDLDTIYWFAVSGASEQNSNLFHDEQVEYTLRVWHEAPTPLAINGWPITGLADVVNHYHIDFSTFVASVPDGEYHHLFIALDSLRNGNTVTYFSQNQISSSCSEGSCAATSRPLHDEFEVEVDYCEWSTRNPDAQSYYVSVHNTVPGAIDGPVKFTLRAYSQAVVHQELTNLGRWESTFFDLDRYEHRVIEIDISNDPLYAQILSTPALRGNVELKIHLSQISWGSISYWFGSETIPSPSCYREKGSLVGDELNQQPDGQVEDLELRPFDELYITTGCDVLTTNTFYLSVFAALSPDWSEDRCSRVINATISAWLEAPEQIPFDKQDDTDDNLIGFNSDIDSREPVPITIYGPGNPIHFTSDDSNDDACHFKRMPRPINPGSWSIQHSAVPIEDDAEFCGYPVRYPRYYQFSPSQSGYYDVGIVSDTYFSRGLAFEQAVDNLFVQVWHGDACKDFDNFNTNFMNCAFISNNVTTNYTLPYPHYTNSMSFHADAGQTYLIGWGLYENENNNLTFVENWDEEYSFVLGGPTFANVESHCDADKTVRHVGIGTHLIDLYEQNIDCGGTCDTYANYENATSIKFIAPKTGNYVFSMCGTRGGSLSDDQYTWDDGANDGSCSSLNNLDTVSGWDCPDNGFSRAYTVVLEENTAYTFNFGSDDNEVFVFTIYFADDATLLAPLTFSDEWKYYVIGPVTLDGEDDSLLIDLRSDIGYSNDDWWWIENEIDANNGTRGWTAPLENSTFAPILPENRGSMDVYWNKISASELGSANSLDGFIQPQNIPGPDEPNCGFLNDDNSCTDSNNCQIQYCYENDDEFFVYLAIRNSIGEGEEQPNRDLTFSANVRTISDLYGSYDPTEADSNVNITQTLNFTEGLVIDPSGYYLELDFTIDSTNFPQLDLTNPVIIYIPIIIPSLDEIQPGNTTFVDWTLGFFANSSPRPLLRSFVKVSDLDQLDEYPVNSPAVEKLIATSDGGFYPAVYDECVHDSLDIPSGGCCIDSVIEGYYVMSFEISNPEEVITDEIDTAFHFDMTLNYTFVDSDLISEDLGVLSIGVNDSIAILDVFGANLSFDYATTYHFEVDLEDNQFFEFYGNADFANDVTFYLNYGVQDRSCASTSQFGESSRWQCTAPGRSSGVVNDQHDDCYIKAAACDIINGHWYLTVVAHNPSTDYWFDIIARDPSVLEENEIVSDFVEWTDVNDVYSQFYIPWQNWNTTSDPHHPLYNRFGYDNEGYLEISVSNIETVNWRLTEGIKETSDSSFVSISSHDVRFYTYVDPDYTTRNQQIFFCTNGNATMNVTASGSGDGTFGIIVDGSSLGSVTDAFTTTFEIDAQEYVCFQESVSNGATHDLNITITFHDENGTLPLFTSSNAENCTDIVDLFVSSSGAAGISSIPDLQYLVSTFNNQANCLSSSTNLCTWSTAEDGCPRTCRIALCDLDSVDYDNEEHPGVYVSLRNSEESSSSTFDIHYEVHYETVYNETERLFNGVPYLVSYLEWDPLTNTSFVDFSNHSLFTFEVGSLDDPTPTNDLGYLFVSVSHIDTSALNGTVVRVFPEDSCESEASYTCTPDVHYYDESVPLDERGYECHVQFDPCVFDVNQQRTWYISVDFPDTVNTDIHNYTIMAEIRQPTFVSQELTYDVSASNWYWSVNHVEFFEEEWHFYHLNLQDIIDWQFSGDLTFSAEVDCSYEDAVEVAFNSRNCGWKHGFATVECNEWHETLGSTHHSDSYHLSACDYLGSDIYIGVKSNINGLGHPNYTIPILYSLSIELEDSPDVAQLPFNVWNELSTVAVSSYLEPYHCSDEHRYQVRFDWRGSEWGSQNRIQLRTKHASLPEVCPRWRYQNQESVVEYGTTTQQSDHYGAECGDLSGCVNFDSHVKDGDYYIYSSNVLTTCSNPGDNTWLYLVLTHIPSDAEVRLIRERKTIEVIDIAVLFDWERSISLVPNQFVYYKVLTQHSLGSNVWNLQVMVSDIVGADSVEISLSRGDLSHPQIATSSCADKSVSCLASDHCVLSETYYESSHYNNDVYWLSLVSSGSSSQANCVVDFQLEIHTYQTEVSLLSPCEIDCYHVTKHETAYYVIENNDQYYPESFVVFDVTELTGHIRITTQQGRIPNSMDHLSHEYNIYSSDLYWMGGDGRTTFSSNYFDFFNPSTGEPYGKVNFGTNQFGFVDEQNNNKREFVPEAGLALSHDYGNIEYDAVHFSPFRWTLPCLHSSEDVYFAIQSISDEATFSFQVQYYEVEPTELVDGEDFTFGSHFGDHGFQEAVLPSLWSQLNDLSHCLVSSGPVVWPNVYKWVYPGDVPFGWNIELNRGPYNEASGDYLGSHLQNGGVTLFVNEGSLSVPFLAAASNQYPGMKGLNPYLSKTSHYEGCSVWPQSSSIFNPKLITDNYSFEENCDLRNRTFYFYVSTSSRSVSAETNSVYGNHGLTGDYFDSPLNKQPFVQKRGAISDIEMQRIQYPSQYTISVWTKEDTSTPLSLGSAVNVSATTTETQEFTYTAGDDLYDFLIFRISAISGLDENTGITVHYWKEGDIDACARPDDYIHLNLIPACQLSNCWITRFSCVEPGATYHFRVSYPDATFQCHLEYTVGVEQANYDSDWIAPNNWEIDNSAITQQIVDSTGLIQFYKQSYQLGVVYELDFDTNSINPNFLHVRFHSVEGADLSANLLHQDIHCVLDSCNADYGLDGSGGYCGNCALYLDTCEYESLKPTDTNYDSRYMIGVAFSGEVRTDLIGYNTYEFELDVTYDWEDLNSKDSDDISILSGDDMDFYMFTSDESVVLNIDVLSGPAVKVWVRDSDCDAHSTWSYQPYYCSHDNCQLVLSAPSQVTTSHSGEYYVIVDRNGNKFQKPTHYQISVSLGSDNAVDFESALQDLSFCSMLVSDEQLVNENTDVWNYGSFELKDQEAEALYDSILDGDFFCTMPNDACLEKLQVWACVETFQSVDSSGFVLPPCKLHCEELEESCGGWLENAGIAEFSCDSPRYAYGDNLCTGIFEREVITTTEPIIPLANLTLLPPTPIQANTTTTVTTTTTSTTTSSTTTTGDDTEWVGSSSTLSVPFSLLVLSLLSIIFNYFL